MPGTKIENLTEDTVLTSAEMDSYFVPVSDGSVNRKLKVRTLQSFGTGTPTAGDVPRYDGTASQYRPANPRWRVLTAGTDYVATVPTRTITAASNTTPIVITAADHKLSTGEHVKISGVGGNTAANGTFEVDANTIRITAASNASPIVLTTLTYHNFSVNDEVRVEGVKGNSAANSTNSDVSWTVSAVTENTLTLSGSVGDGTYDGGGWVSWADKFKLRVIDNTSQVSISGASVSGSGATVSITATSGVITAVTATPPAGGSGYPASATFVIGVTQGAATGGYVTATTNGSGVITSFSTTPAFGGTGYTTATGLSLDDDSTEVRITTSSAHGFGNWDRVIVVGVVGTIEANNTTTIDTWQIHHVTTTTMQLVGSTFANAWTSGGTVELAYANKLIDVAGNGAYTSGGSFIRPGRITIVTTGATDALLQASAQALGFYVGLPIRMTTPARTTYGIIGAIPGSTGYPPRIGGANLPANLEDELTFCGPPLTDNLTELAIGNAEMVRTVELDCNHFPYYGSTPNYPISQLVQGTTSTATLQDKWRVTNGGDVYSAYGKGLRRWVGPQAYCVAFGVSHQVVATAGIDGQHGGTTVTLSPDRTRAYNASEQHTDGYHGQGTLVTRAAGATLPEGDSVTGLRGHSFYWLDSASGQNDVIEQSVIREGGYGSDLCIGVVGATNASPIVITTASAHGLTTGCKVTIFSVTGNTAANVTSNSITKLSATTFSLDGTTGNGTYGGVASDVTITAATAATPIVITTATAHGYSAGDQVVITGVLGNIAANGLHKIMSSPAPTSTTFAIGGLAGTGRTYSGTYGGGGTVTKGGGFMRNGLDDSQCVLESLTLPNMTESRVANEIALSAQYYLIDDIAQQPTINVDIGGQLLSPHDFYRGLRVGPYENRVVVYNPPAEINPEVYDNIFYGGRFELAVTSMGNKPGQRTSTVSGSGGAEYLSAFLTFVIG